MIKGIPKDLENLYQKAGWKEKLYLKARWRLCPFEEIEKYLPLKGKIIDFGCGYGILANFLALKSGEREVIGIDSSPKRIEVAKLSVGDRKNLQFLNQDIRDITLEFCDGVVMTDFLHHISPAISRDVLKLIYRKLNSQGKLVIQDVDKLPRWKYFITLLIDRLLNIGRFLYYRSSTEWKKILEETGFKVEIVPAHQGLFLADVLLICSI